ncbi:sigma-54 interaction domain-containing protein [Methylococcus capsulatus]|jgi:transcriptional regulator with PAS, ATPase and Fis domain|uniref:sigma-54 interaction domain-containing protein n=1 Tax=Methylococcus capsulatus TaxID=414 RepID=UPI001C52D6C4|nr:sigma 54-interacting transcriptional regulator [Methylococcus capsulatus]QXP94823.1 sigma 54-interacting transcriptional regulator [Methylococcus capsulatus]
MKRRSDTPSGLPLDTRCLLDALAGLECTGALYLLDEEERVSYWSSAAEQLTGHTGEFATGESIARLLPGYGPPRADDGRGEDEIRVERADGSALLLRRRYHPLRDREGAARGRLEVLTAIETIGTPLAEADVEILHGLLTREPAMKQVFRLIRNVAETEATVLVRGESGTGKELVARAVHAESHRAREPFLAVNCAALAPSLLESELFGHVRGAFTGAVRSHAGLFQRADGGTLFLDEVAELPLELQAKLLRVLQERSIVPVGGDRTLSVDVRIVAATHRSLRDAVREGRFREDLMYRLRVVPLFLPPLRERRRDIGLLLWHFIERHNARGLRRIVRIDPDAMRRLLDHAWPGNVRELQNVVEYAFAVGRGEVLEVDDLPPEFRDERAGPQTSMEAVPDEADRIRTALRQSGGRIDQAARLLQMSRATLWRKRKKLGV